MLELLLVLVLTTYDKQVLEAINIYNNARKEVICLTQNIYFEARNQSDKGQVAIGQVTINRVNSSIYPSTICEVVKQPAQFSWYWDGKSDSMKDKKARTKSYEIAAGVLFNKFEDFVRDALYYHTFSVSPEWSRNMELTTYIDNHMFYK